MKYFCIANVIWYILSILAIIFVRTKDLKTKNVFTRVDTYMYYNDPEWKTYSKKYKIGLVVVVTLLCPIISIPGAIGFLIYKKLKK